MDTVKVGNVTIDTSKLKRLEELVDLVDADYDYHLSNYHPLIREIREITGSTLDDDQIYYEYCSHYIGGYSLEEVVYALINDGEYPKTDECEISFWKRFWKPIFTDDDIYTAHRFRYMENKKKAIRSELEIFLLDELLEEVENQLPDWEMRESDRFTPEKYTMDFYTFYPKKLKQYGFGENIHISIYDDRFACVTFFNIDESVRNLIVEKMKTLGNTVYHDEVRKRYPADYKLTDEKKYARKVEENEIAFWKVNDKTDLTDNDIYKNFFFRENEKIEYKGVLKSISIDKIYAFLISPKQGSFYEWNVEVSDNRLGQRFVILRPNADAEEKYDIPPYIIISLYYGEIGTVTFRNVDESVRDKLEKYITSLKYTVFS